LDQGEYLDKAKPFIENSEEVLINVFRSCRRLYLYWQNLKQQQKQAVFTLRTGTLRGFCH